MPPQKTSAKDFFINLGAIVSLYTLVVSLLNLLFTIINTAYPKITTYDYLGSTSISWPVATLIIFFPIFILLMWLLEREYKVNPEKQNSGIHKWLTYITLFLAGVAIAVDLITVLYYFLDGQELTTGFILKVMALLMVAAGVFSYYLTDALGKLTSQKRIIYRVVATLMIVGAIVWGFMVLGSPNTQRLYKYDQQKVTDLQSLNSLIDNFYQVQHKLPATLAESKTVLNSDYYPIAVDPQTGAPYQYEKTGNLTYNLCAEFNKASLEAQTPNMYMRPIGYQSWMHGAGHVCFNQTIIPANYPKSEPISL